MRILAAALLVGLLPTFAVANTDVRDGIHVLAFQSCEQLDKVELDRLRDKGVSIKTIDVDLNPAMADRYGIKTLPTYVVEQNGVEIKRTGSVSVLGAFLIALLAWLIL